jgi:hypothetical protein
LIVRRTVLTAAALGIFAFAAAAHAQEWRPIARQCAAEIDAKAGCGSCGGLWPAWSRCTVERFYHGAIPAARVEPCLRQVGEIRAREHACDACGDPVAAVIHCARGS